MLDVNTVSHYPTHFLRAIELIEGARDKFNVCSENWPNPMEYRFGIPRDNYYAEIWVDGMDWQPSYWVIEEVSYHKPQIQPLLIFNQNETRSKFNSWDFEEFIMAMLWYRRDLLWIKHDSLGHYRDSVWSFLYYEKDGGKPHSLNYFYNHASQPKVKFWVNEDFIPEQYRRRIYEENRNNRDEKPGQLGSI